MDSLSSTTTNLLHNLEWVISVLFAFIFPAAFFWVVYLDYNILGAETGSYCVYVQYLAQWVLRLDWGHHIWNDNRLSRGCLVVSFFPVSLMRWYFEKPGGCLILLFELMITFEIHSITIINHFK